MTKDQLVNEEDLKDICVYCSENLSDAEWQSEFLCNTHYKTTLCNCGKKISVKVDFLGSGHDQWGNGCDKVIAKDKSDGDTIDKKIEGKS